MERLKLLLKVLLFMSMPVAWSCSFDPPQMEAEEEKCSTFTASEAQSVFEGEVMGVLTRSAYYDDSYYRRRFMWNIGEITPDWETATCTKAGHLENVDVQIRSTNRYRVIQTDPVTGKQRKVKCYHKLLVAKDVETGRTGNFIVFFIATNQYSKTHKGFINEWFNNDGNMGDFSGLKVYTKLDGKIVRVNKYESGRKTSGIYLGNVRNIEEFALKMTDVFRLMKNLKIQKGTYRGGALTKAGEDDSSWDYGESDSIWIDASVCYDDCNNDNWGDDDWGDDWDDDWDDDIDPDVDSGSNDSSHTDDSSVADDEPSTTSATVGHLTITGNVSDVQNIVNELTRDNTSRPLILNLLNNLTTCITIRIVDSFSSYSNSAAHAVYYPNSQVIEILSSESEYPWVLYEELLHAYQRQEEGTDWTTGDMEFEAKVFDAVLDIEYGMYFGIDDDISDIFYKYYTEQSDINFENALNALYGNPYCYDKDLFPVTENLDDRLKHIK